MITSQTPFTPKELGYDAGRLEVLNSHFAGMVERDELQGATYCIARDGKVFADSAMGRRCFRHDDERPLQPDHLHKIASITKMFCIVSIFKLAEDGKLMLAQKVGDFIEEFSHPPFNEITIAHLLSHTSGLQADGGCYENPYFLSPWECMDKGFKSGEDNWIKSALKSGMRMKPGEEWAYCSFGFTILGEIISRVSGVFANDYIRDNVIKPCGLSNTFFTEEITPELAARVIITDEHREEFINKITAGTNEPDEEELKWRKIPASASGLFSNAQDLVKFGNMLAGGGYANGNRILGRKAIEKMTARFTTSDIKDYCWGAGGVERAYGLGPDLRCNLTTIYSPGTYFHEGAGGCTLIIDPVEKLVAAWFVPFMKNVWKPQALYNASAIMWSGLI